MRAVSPKPSCRRPRQSGPQIVARALVTRLLSQGEFSSYFHDTDEALTIVASEPSSPQVQPDTLLDTYFARFHAKPYHILDESSVRQRLQLNQVPMFLMHAIYAVASRYYFRILAHGFENGTDASRYTAHPNGYQAAVRSSEDYATRARADIDTDEPSVDALQSLLLLVTAFTAAGKGKKAYMLLSTVIPLLHHAKTNLEQHTP